MKAFRVCVSVFLFVFAAITLGPFASTHQMFAIIIIIVAGLNMGLTLRSKWRK